MRSNYGERGAASEARVPHTSCGKRGTEVGETATRLRCAVMAVPQPVTAGRQSVLKPLAPWLRSEANEASRRQDVPVSCDIALLMPYPGRSIRR